MTTKLLTIKKLAAELGEDYITTFSLIKFLHKIGAIKETGTKEGKAVIYEIPNVLSCDLVFWDEQEAEQEAEQETEQKTMEETYSI